MLINGVDTNFPLDPSAWFSRRFFVWNALANGGADFSSSTAGIFFHFIQVLPYKLGFTLQIVQIFSYLFWFTTTIISSFILARIIFIKKTLVQLLFVVLYSFNIYLFNTWENSKVTNLALVSAIPFAIALLISLWNKKVSYAKATIYSILIGILISGGGINPAYFFAFFLILFIFLLTNIFSNNNSKSSLRKIYDFLLISIFVILVNAFWIIPTVGFITSNIPGQESVDKIGFTNWLDSLSEHTSLLNILRLQGAWDWYAFDSLSGLPLYIPYALNYFYNFPFIVFSFIIPGLAILSFIFYNKQKQYLYWSGGVLLLIGVFLGSGTHPPTGYLFNLLTQYLPFFTLLRSPWYIFTPLLIVAYSILICLLFSNLQEKLIFSKFKTFILIIFIVVFGLGNLIYSYPLISGKIFRPTQPDTFYVKFPNYIFDAKVWLDKNKQGRIIGYPDDEIEKFKWGYRGIDSILNLIVDQETLFSSLNATNSGISILIKEFYQNLKKDQIDAATKIIAKANVAFFFEKQDQESLALPLPDKIKNLPSNQFGQWKFYRLPNNDILPKIYVATSLTSYNEEYQKEKILGILEKNEILVNKNDNVVQSIPNISNLSGLTVVGKNSQYEDFVEFAYKPSKLSNRLIDRDLTKVEYLFTLQQGGTYQPILEKYNLAEFKKDYFKQFEVIIDGKNMVWEAQSETDSYLYFQQIVLNAGDHKISIFLDNKNLTLQGNFNNDSDFTKEGDGTFEVNKDQNNLTIMNRSDKDISANFQLSSFDPLSQYLIKVKYKQIYGNNASIVLKQFRENIPFKTQVERLPNYPEVNSFNFYYEPVKTNSQVTISLSAPMVKDPLGTKIIYDELEVYKVFASTLILKRNAENLSSTLPNVNFQQKSPVLYEGIVENSNKSHIIVFSETYSPDWELSLTDMNGVKIDVNSLHFSTNLYANAWYVNGISGGYKMKIYYKPQNLFLVGVTISVVTILFTFILTVWIFSKHKLYFKK